MSNKVQAGVYTAPDGNTNQFKNNGAPTSQDAQGLSLKNLGPGTAYLGGSAAGTGAADMYPLDVGESIPMELLTPQNLYLRLTTGSKLAWIKTSA